MEETTAGIGSVIEDLVKAFVDHPDAVRVSEGSRSDATVLELRVDPEDLGKVIGRQGRTARALRSLASIAGEKAGRRIILQILD
jgi:predicted RNA-binding protein YlqC (UPF0109 family)